MLIFLSDVHLTDGSSGTTIDPRAFKKFCRILEDVVGDPAESKISKMELCLLGDIFDVIRSDLWLRPENSDTKKPVRPWSADTDKDGAGWDLRKYTEEIVDRIVSRKENIEAMGYLRQCQERCSRKGVDTTVSYVMGNHDWLLNRYAATRKKIAGFLGMANPEHYDLNVFPHEQLFEKYSVLARHGDRYDEMNYEGDRNASSLGDAIVIDLLNRFPKVVENDPDLGKNSGLVARLREIDNVRPLLEIPAWIQGVCNTVPGVEQRVHAIWNELVRDFFRIKFVKEHDRFGPDRFDFLQAALCLSSGFSFRQLQKVLSTSLARNLYQKADDYRRHAYNEADLKNNRVRYVVYGHTHHAQQAALDIVPIPGGETLEKIYFNCGTWRKVFEPTAFDRENLEFIGWHVMTFLAFYLPEEKEQDRKYEAWSASLGFGR